MFKRTVIMVLALSFLAAGISLAAPAGDGNYRKGKYLFRKNCRSCHSEGKSAKELSPISKTQANWKAAFADDKVAGYPCKDAWAKVGEKGINDIYTYLYKHAKDSPTPAKCK